MAENPTDNHDLDRPLVGSATGRDSEDWGSELNNNFAVIDNKLVVVDTDANTGNYTPTSNALYYAYDADQWYRGNGTEWVAGDTSGPSQTFDDLTLNNSLSVGSSATVNGSTVLTEADEGSGGGINADQVDGYEGSSLASLNENESINSIWTYNKRVDFENTVNISGDQAQIDLYESDDNDRNWRIEAQSSQLKISEVGQGEYLRIDSNDGYRVEHPEGAAFGGVVTINDSIDMAGGPITNGDTATLTPRSSAPSSPSSGMIACSDGTNWDPTASGSEEIVAYLNGGWTALS